jgi:hypothetical protein
LRRWNPTALDLRGRFPQAVSQNLFLLAMLLDFPPGEYPTSCNRGIFLTVFFPVDTIFKGEYMEFNGYVPAGNAQEDDA